MQVTDARHTRQGALARIGAAIGGAIGLGYTAGSARAAPAAVPPAASRQETLVVHGRAWRVSAGSLVPSGALADARGAALGRFRAATLPGAAAHYQIHTFELAGGTLLGVGGGALREAVFAVVGGTGAYAGATGSYVARQSPREAGGDGTAVFTFTLTIPEG